MSNAATDGGTSYGSDEEMLADFRERMKPLDSAATLRHVGPAEPWFCE